MMTPEPINLRAGRIASLMAAAEVVLTGSSLADERMNEAILLDLLYVASEQARRLARDTEEARYGVTAG